mmetsp:Transcript_6090/g.13877  ORF Transcript_6090/g.13877 Transcript_6090/m.13877 type:complete len:216 (+) Transcript_6090:2429-3076(+)
MTWTMAASERCPTMWTPTPWTRLQAWAASVVPSTWPTLLSWSAWPRRARPRAATSLARTPNLETSKTARTPPTARGPTAKATTTVSGNRILPTISPSGRQAPMCFGHPGRRARPRLLGASLRTAGRGAGCSTCLRLQAAAPSRKKALRCHRTCCGRRRRRGKASPGTACSTSRRGRGVLLPAPSSPEGCPRLTLDTLLELPGAGRSSEIPWKLPA